MNIYNYMTIYEYFKIHDNTYMKLKSLIHEIHNTLKLNTLRTSVLILVYETFNSTIEIKSIIRM